MTDEIATLLKNIETHADALMDIPSGEQYLSNMQAVISVALLDVKRCLEALAVTKGDDL